MRISKDVANKFRPFKHGILCPVVPEWMRERGIDANEVSNATSHIYLYMYVIIIIIMGMGWALMLTELGSWLKIMIMMAYTFSLITDTIPRTFLYFLRITYIRTVYIPYKSTS